MNYHDISGILKRNILTPVVISLYSLSALLLIVREFRDAWFVSFVITLNTTFAVVQEVRARRALKKLELLNAPFARLMDADGEITHIPFNEVTVAQHLQLIPGDDVPADGEIVESRGLEVDESMLTGESASVPKQPGDTIFGSSTVAAGTASFVVTATGSDTRAGIMTQQLRQYTPELTPLQRTLTRLITGLTFFALILSVLIVVIYSRLQIAPNIIIKTITAAGVVIIPEGLILGSTVLLAYGSLRLARAKVLPQKLSAIEAMALTQVLCTDKTGTLTSETIALESVTPLSDDISEASLTTLCGAAASCMGGGTPTADALLASLPSHPEAIVHDTLAFTSQRKLSGVRFTIDGEKHTIMTGAPEFVSVYAPLTAKAKRMITALTEQGLRVLLVAEFSDSTTPLTSLRKESARAIGIITLRNNLRDGVTETVAYLQNRGVSIRVISGDNPLTVSYIAKTAGITHADRIITGSELAKLPKSKWDRVVLETTIFARVLPEQKEALIRTFQRDGSYTGMVGDGINDALALKTADLGIAMFSGANATRRVADIVLLNNSFNALPIGMRLGNRIMLAIEIISILFFHKIIYGVVVLLTTMALSYPYPFAPRHNTFMNVFMVTLPTIMLTLFPPRPRLRVNPKHFWRDTLVPTIPLAVISGLTVTITYLFATDVLHLTRAAAGTISVVVATLFGINIVFRAPQMLAVITTKSLRFARLAYIIVALIVATISFGFSFSRSFFDFTNPNVEQLTKIWPILGMVAIALIVQGLIALEMKRRLLRRSNRQ